MKIVTSTNILLEQNIIAIYTNVEKFIEAVESCEGDGLLRFNQKDKTLLNNILYVDNDDNDCTFFGFFYSVDPFDVDMDVEWTVLTSREEYETVLSAINNDDLFMMVRNNDLFKHGDHNISTVGSTGLENLTYAEDEPDEYDEDDLELDEDMFGDYLDTMNDEETDLC